MLDIFLPFKCWFFSNDAEKTRQIHGSNEARVAHPGPEVRFTERLQKHHSFGRTGIIIHDSILLLYLKYSVRRLVESQRLESAA